MTTPAKRHKLAASRPRPLAIGYARVSTEEQTKSGAGLAAQQTGIRAEAEARGWDLVMLTEASMSGGVDALDRPVLGKVLAMLESGEADHLIVYKLDRLSRDVHDGTGVLRMAVRESWGLVAIDLAVDTTTDTGRMMLQMRLMVAEQERLLISRRTRDALAAKRAQGVRLGRPSQLPEAVILRVLAERAAGVTLQAIADGLASDNVATAQGGSKWFPATVAKVIRGQDAQRLAAE